MPYIEKEERARIDRLVEQLVEGTKNLGEANYVITRFIHRSIEETYLDYATLNAFIGILECAKLELYRMVVGPYENKKRMENGPVSDLDAKSLEEIR